MLVLLSEAVDSLPDTELEIVLCNAQRLVKGFAEYGPLESNLATRDLEEEFYQEMQDAANYAAMAVVRRRRLRALATVGHGRRIAPKQTPPVPDKRDSAVEDGRAGRRRP